MTLTMTVLVAAAMSASPLTPDAYAGTLAPQAAVESAVLGARGGEIYQGVRMTVSGSILVVLGGAFGGLGAWGLIGAANATGSEKTVFTVLGWTSAGFGMLLGAVGIPLLIVGIVKLANPSGLSLTVDHRGELAVAF